MRRTARTCAQATCVLGLIVLSLPTEGQEAAQPAKLNIVIVEGDGAINNIKQRVNREPIVQVEDENHKPIAGAAVAFALPNQGPGGTFADGTHSITVTTNAQGRATVPRVRLNNQPGQMAIRVTASYLGSSATATITQTNVLAAAGAGAAATGLSLAAKILIVVAVAGGAAAAGTVVATRGGGSSSTTTIPSGPSTISLTAGVPVVGAPK